VSLGNNDLSEESLYVVSLYEQLVWRTAEGAVWLSKVGEKEVVRECSAFPLNVLITLFLFPLPLPNIFGSEP
jgi:hypothetical protein